MRTVRVSSKGMTLAEVLIASTLSALLLISLGAAAGNVFTMYRAGGLEMSLSQDIALGLSSVMRTIRKAEDAVLSGSHGIVLTKPSGEQITYDWSGTAGDPMTLQIDAGAILPLVDGITALDFQINTKDIEEDKVSSLNAQLHFFDYWPGTAGFDQWRGVTYLGTDDYCGIAFSIPSATEIEALVLTQARIRLGKLMGQSGNLRISLRETYTPDIPRLFGPTIAYKDFPNSAIPWATDVLDPWASLNFGVFDLDSSFTLHPNRSYCLLLESLGPGDACCVRIRMSDKVDMPTSDEYNGQWVLISHDNGATWIPDFGTDEMIEWDVPTELIGDVVTLDPNTVTVNSGVEVSMTIEQKGKVLRIQRQELLMGGGTL